VLEPDTVHRVIGLVQDTRHFGLDQTTYAQYFVPLRQRPTRTLSVAMRLRAPLPRADLRALVASVDATVPLYDVRTFDTIVSGSLASRRSLTGTVAACGSAAVLLAVIGLFGIVATGVRDRRREIGIRVALGASGRGVVWLFVRRAAVLAGAAIGAGLVASYWATGLLLDFLFGVEPLDPATLAAAAFGLFGVSAAATWLSARHAARVDPIDVLRSE
jgi:ABC-type antimicrobial peptide transport system permease subunit